MKLHVLLENKLVWISVNLQYSMLSGWCSFTSKLYYSVLDTFLLSCSLIQPYYLCIITTDLSISEEKDDWQILETSLQETGLYILSPLWHSVVLGQLNLETVVVRPAHSQTQCTASVHVYFLNSVKFLHSLVTTI